MAAYIRLIKEGFTERLSIFEGTEKDVLRDKKYFKDFQNVIPKYWKLGKEV